MLSQAVLDEIARLLAANADLPPEERLSNRQIAEKVGCDRRPVDEWARGIRRKRKRADAEADSPGTIGRCPWCGHKVELPCRACALERR